MLIKKDLKSPKSEIKLTLKNISLVLFSTTAWLGLKPYIILNHNEFLSFFVYLSFILVILFNSFSKKKIEILFAIIYFLICIFFFIPGSESVNKSISLGFLSISIILFLNNSDRIRLIENFRIIYVITLIPSLTIYFLDLIGFSPNYSIINGFKNPYIGYDFLGSFGNVKTTISEGFLVYRFQGMYDEPGVIGTISGLLLLIENFNFKKKFNYLLLVSGFASLSMAFYIITLLYIVFVKKINIKYLIITILLIFSMTQFKFTRYYIIERLRFNTETGKLKFDNRVSSSFQELYDSKIKNGDIFHKVFGYGSNAHSKNNFNVASYKALIYNKGYFGFILIILFYLFYFRYYIKEYQNQVIILIFLTSIYQRPDVVSLFYSIIFFGGVSKLYYKELLKKTNTL